MDTPTLSDCDSLTSYESLTIDEYYEQLIDDLLIDLYQIISKEDKLLFDIIFKKLISNDEKIRFLRKYIRNNNIEIDNVLI